MTQAEFPLALVPVAVSPLVLPVSVCLVIDPLSDIAVTTLALPNSIAVFDLIDPFAVVGVTVHPRVETLAADPAHIVVTQVLVPVAESLVAFAVALVIRPGSFIDSTDFVHTDSLAFTEAVHDFTTIQRGFVTLNREVLPCLQLFEIKQISHHLVLHVLLLLFKGQVLLCRTSFALFLGLVGLAERVL